jgi:hypothetical protein
MNFGGIAMGEVTKVTTSLPEQFLKAVEAYIQGYRTAPESMEKIETAHRAGVSILAEEPWD